MYEDKKQEIHRRKAELNELCDLEYVSDVNFALKVIAAQCARYGDPDLTDSPSLRKEREFPRAIYDAALNALYYQLSGVDYPVDDPVRQQEIRRQIVEGVAQEIVRRSIASLADCDEPEYVTLVDGKVSLTDWSEE